MFCGVLQFVFLNMALFVGGGEDNSDYAINSRLSPVLWYVRNFPATLVLVTDPPLLDKLHVRLFQLFVCCV